MVNKAPMGLSMSALKNPPEQLPDWRRLTNKNQSLAIFAKAARKQLDDVFLSLLSLL